MVNRPGIGNEYRGLIDDAFLSLSRQRSEAHFRRRLWERDAGLCGLCQQAVPLEEMHVDHVKPRAVGGADHWDNLQPSHPQCNMRAKTKGYPYRPRRVRSQPLLPSDTARFQLRLSPPEHARIKDLAIALERSQHWVGLRALRIGLAVLEEQILEASQPQQQPQRRVAEGGTGYAP